MEIGDYIDFNEVHRLTRYSRAHIDRLEWDPKYMGDDPFPARLPYGNSRVVWIRTEVVAWALRRIKRVPRQATRKGTRTIKLIPVPQIRE